MKQFKLGRTRPASEGLETDILGLLVNRFLAWRLPESVCSDRCVSAEDYPFKHLRCGTNLLSAGEAAQMIKYLFAGMDRPQIDALVESIKEPL